MRLWYIIKFYIYVISMHKNLHQKTHIIIIVIFMFLFIARQNFVAANKTKLSVEKEDLVTLLISSSQSIITEHKSQSEKKFNTEFDIDSESSYQKYISDKTRVSTKYVPEDLELIKSDYITNKSSTSLLRNNTNNALFLLSKSFYKKFNKKLYLFSAYRSSSYQRYLVSQWCRSDLCARPGGSEHQLGLAVDIHVTSDRWWIISMWWEYYERLSENAYKYWFINTYEKGYEIDWKVKEPWHWRYVWIAFSTYLKNNNLTIAEYYNLKNNLNSNEKNND